MTIEQIKAVVASYVNAAKQAGTWSTSKDNLAGLLDKIAKTVTIDGIFTDKLGFMDGEELGLGKTVEEYFQDLDSVNAYNDYKSDDSTAANDALKPYYPTYRPATYNYTLGRKIIPTTLKYNEYERACNSADELGAITNMVLKRLYDTYGMFKYDAKKQILANAIKKCDDMKTSTSALDGETAAPVKYAADATTSVTKAIVANNRYYLGDSMAAATAVAVAVKSRASAASTWNADVAAGILVPLVLVEKLAIPEDTATGEAFIEAVKSDVEVAGFVNEGNSLNGNTVGAETGLVLVVKKGIKPIIDVQVEAGAFNPDKLVVPAEIVVVDDFGNDTTGAYAVLCDKRALRLHPTYMAVREQLNGAGDYVNYFLHTENTAFISKNCFIKVFVDD